MFLGANCNTFHVMQFCCNYRTYNSFIIQFLQLIIISQSCYRGLLQLNSNELQLITIELILIVITANYGI